MGSKYQQHPTKLLFLPLLMLYSIIKQKHSYIFKDFHMLHKYQ